MDSNLFLPQTRRPRPFQSICITQRGSGFIYNKVSFYLDKKVCCICGGAHQYYRRRRRKHGVLHSCPLSPNIDFKIIKVT